MTTSYRSNGGNLSWWMTSKHGQIHNMRISQSRPKCFDVTDDGNTVVVGTESGQVLLVQVRTST